MANEGEGLEPNAGNAGADQGDRRRFALLIGAGLLVAGLQVWLMPAGRSPSLARTTADNAYAKARDTVQTIRLADLGDDKWQHARLYAQGADLMAACNALAAGQADCRDALANPPKQVVLLGFVGSTLTRIEQLPADLISVEHCNGIFAPGQQATLQRSRETGVAIVDCHLPSAPRQ
jgi:hypothetical protein